MTALTPQARQWAWRIACVALAGLLALACAFPSLWQRDAAGAVQTTRLALLIPDDVAMDDVHVTLWQDAAREAGFPLDVVRASTLLRAGGYPMDAALILPDTVHRRMNDALVLHLQARVEAGARVMLVQDAGVADMDGNYHPGQSRLSNLAGVRYALYGELGARMTGEQVAWVDPDAVPVLGLPPGKLLRQDGSLPLTSAQAAPAADEELAVASYNYGRLRYPVYQTSGRLDGKRLMHFSGGGLLAGLHTVGQGQVLFVNLPLGYLKLRTDGYFLQSFLRYFAQDVVGLPQLSPMPDAQGALIMNWHIDSAAAVPAMESLSALGAFEQGPYSVHLTAGPDVDAQGDGLGMDLARNPAMREWVRRFAERGDSVGSHGGWIHNEFGRLVDTQDRGVSERELQMNLSAVQMASARPVHEYSAPIGNHPAWVTDWLEAHGIRAYYFTGDIGSAPSRAYQDGRRGASDMWAFPVMSYGIHASFEEARFANVPEPDIAAWLMDVADFCVAHRTVRLVYFHPPGIAMFPGAFKAWMQHTAMLARERGLRWTTMAQYAAFSNDRLEVDWRIAPDDATPGAMRLQASHPRSLKRFTWLLPAQRYGRPQLLTGDARIDLQDGFWRVVAGEARAVSLSLPPRAAATDAPRTLSNEPSLSSPSP